ncbi:hypothetical protein [Nocardia mangyaensis]|nr:hypothetical protein [Nocardia mangyaensis]
MDDLDTAADLFALGERGREDLPMVAAEALARGLDSPALIELACLHRTDTRDAPDLFRTALAELGLDGPSWPQREADIMLRRASQHAERLLSGDGDPLEHLSRISTHLFTLVRTPTSQRADLDTLAADFEYLWGCAYDGYRDLEDVLDDARRGCRHLLAGPPYEPIYQRVVSTDSAAVAKRPWWRTLPPWLRRVLRG